ncbi:MAG TPA: hypothetical protein DCQ32_01810 [Cyanobacteria bacterium UBA8156]|jgi:TonB family protein|nr:hypothetical protein [Cyanobacteria bacterium UBA8156]
MKREGLCLALSLALHAALWQIPGSEVTQSAVSAATVALGEPIPVVTLPPELPETMPLPTAGLTVTALPSQPLREIELNPQGLPPPITFESPELELPEDAPPIAVAPVIPPAPPPQTEPPPPAEPPPAKPFGQLLAAAYSEYGFERVLARQIAPPDVPVPPEKRELGIDWIPPDPAAAAGQTGTVTVLLIVAPDGTVERELIDSEGDRNLVDLARSTAAQYRFAPLTTPDEQGKYRFVTVKYVFAPPVDL